jgi:hypothetical protein
MTGTACFIPGTPGNGGGGFWVARRGRWQQDGVAPEPGFEFRETPSRKISRAAIAQSLQQSVHAHCHVLAAPEDYLASAPCIKVGVMKSP